MIEKVIINNKEIIVKNYNEIIHSHKYGKEKITLYINNVYYLKTKDFIQYTCDGCGNDETKEYAYNYNKYHQNEVLCGECLKKKSRLEKYGVENFFQKKEIHKKARINRSTQEAKNKTKQTKLSRYGTENYNNKEKTKQTCIKRYGGNSPMSDPVIKGKLNIYWNNLKNDDYNTKVKNKRKETCLKKYGVEYTTQTDIMKEKSKQTCLKNYGVEYPAQNPEIHRRQMSRFGKTNTLKQINEDLHYQTIPELECIEYCQFNNTNIWDGPSIPYIFENKKHIYHVDFETDEYIIEIKGSHGWYKKNLASGKIEAKNKAAQEYAASVNKEFLFLLDIKNYLFLGSKFLQE